MQPDIERRVFGRNIGFSIVGSNFKIGPAMIDRNGIMVVKIDEHVFHAGEKYTILEMGWAVYLADSDVPHEWMQKYGETRPADDSCSELASSEGMLVTSHPVLVALALRAWWHRNGQPIPKAPNITILSVSEAVEVVRHRAILNDFNQCYAGAVPGLHHPMLRLLKEFQ